LHVCRFGGLADMPTSDICQLRGDAKDDVVGERRSNGWWIVANGVAAKACRTGAAPMSPPSRTSGGGNLGSLPVPWWLVPDHEKCNGRQDQGAELSSQGVTEVDRDGSERC
jgi:hypothetical protein